MNDKIKRNEKFCPFVKTPFDECFCASLRSRDVEKIIYFCSNNYKECEIYKRSLEQKEISKELSQRL